MKDHMSQCEKIGSVPNYSCAYCYIVFRRKEERELHMNSHGDTAFRCSLCDDFDEDQASWAVLKKHYMNEHDLSVYHKKQLHKCPDCDKVYKNQKGLKQHRFSVHEGGVRKCPHCEKKFKSSDALRVHVDSKHGFKMNMMCEVCGFEAENEKLLQAHQQADHKEKKHRCEKCDATFSSPADLEKHVGEMHPRDPNSVQCSICKIWLTNAKLLKRHKLYQHNPHRIPMRCTMCGYRTFKKLELKNHMIKKHDLGAPDPDQQKANSKKTNTTNGAGTATNRRARKRHNSDESWEGPDIDIPLDSPRKKSRTSSRTEDLVLKDTSDEYTFKRHMSIYTTPRARASALAKMERLLKANEKKEDQRLQLEKEREHKRVLKQKAKARKERLLKRKNKLEKLKAKRKKQSKEDENSKAKKERKKRSPSHESKKEKDQAKVKRKKLGKKDKDDKKAAKETSPKSEGKKKERSGLTHRYRPLSEPHCDHSYCRRPVQENTDFYIHTLSKEDIEKGDWVISAEDEIYGVEIETSPVKHLGSDYFEDPYGDLLLNVPKTVSIEDGMDGLMEHNEVPSVGTFSSSTSASKTVALSIINNGLRSALQLNSASNTAALHMEKVPGSPPAQLLQTESPPPGDSNHGNSSDDTPTASAATGWSAPGVTSDPPDESQGSKAPNLTCDDTFEDDIEIPTHPPSGNVSVSDGDGCNDMSSAACEHSYASRSQPQETQASCEAVEETITVMQNMVADAEPQIFQDILHDENRQEEAAEGIQGNNSDVIDTDLLPNMDILDALMQQSEQDNEDLLSFYEKD